MRRLKRSWLYTLFLGVAGFLCALAGQLEGTHAGWQWLVYPLPGVALMVLTSQLHASREWIRGYRDGIDDGNSNATRAELEKARNDGYSYGYAQGIQEGRLEGMTNGLKAGWSMAQNPTVAGVVGDIIDGEEA